MCRFDLELSHLFLCKLGWGLVAFTASENLISELSGWIRQRQPVIYKENSSAAHPFFLQGAAEKHLSPGKRVHSGLIILLSLSVLQEHPRRILASKSFSRQKQQKSPTEQANVPLTLLSSCWEGRGHVQLDKAACGGFSWSGCVFHIRFSPFLAVEVPFLKCKSIKRFCPLLGF